MNTVPLINGREYSWADITVLIGGVPLAGITAVEYKETWSVENHRGAGIYPVSRSTGVPIATAKIAIDMNEILALQSQSRTGSLRDLPPFTLQISYIPDGVTGMIVHDVVHNCQFQSNERKWKEGDMRQTVEYELVPTHITWGRKG